MVVVTGVVAFGIGVDPSLDGGDGGLELRGMACRVVPVGLLCVSYDTI